MPWLGRKTRHQREFVQPRHGGRFKDLTRAPGLGAEKSHHVEGLPLAEVLLALVMSGATAAHVEPLPAKTVTAILDPWGNGLPLTGCSSGPTTARHANQKPLDSLGKPDSCQPNAQACGMSP